MITLDQRVQSRLAIARMTSLLDQIELSMERGTDLPDSVSFLVGQVAQSDNIETQHTAIDMWLENTRAEYLSKLREAARESLSCFAELMNPEEPPARHHEWLCGKLEMVARRQLMRLMVSMPPGFAKALALDTPIPTPSGWTTMGALRVGDELFDETGAVCRVVRKTDVWKERPTYKVTTDCEDSIIADEKHEWLTRLCGKREVFKLKTTKYLAERQAAGSSKRPMISHAKALKLPEAVLPVDPYVIGFWLGDGNSESPRFTAGNEDRDWVKDEFTRLGFEVNQHETEYNFSIIGVRHLFTQLRLLGNKHIPDIYMRASIAQRQAILQGLIDSDGHVAPCGQIAFTTTLKPLAEQVQELVRTLGAKASIVEERAVLNGEDHGPCWSVHFYMKDGARLPRKANFTRNGVRTPGTYIDVVYDGLGDTVCIEVDSPSHLFLAGRSMTPTHNSTYCSHIFPAWYLGRNPNHRYIQAGHTQDFVDEEFGKRVRGNIDNETFRSVFPEIKLDPGSRAASRFALAGFRGKYLGRGVGQGISGFRANVAAVDDPFASREDAESQTIRKKVFDWFMADLTTRLLPRSPLFIVATRWHTDDLCGRLEEMNKKGVGLPWDIINLSAISDGSPDPLNRAENESLWPEFYNLEHLLNLRATLPSRDWNSLFMGQPTDAQGGSFKSEWVQRYDNYPTNDLNEAGRVTKINIRRIVVSVDTASKTSERNDYTAITVWIEDAFRKHYLVEVIRDRLEFDDMVKRIEDTVNKWNAQIVGSKVAAILVEDKGSGTQYIQTRRDKAPAPVVAIEVGTNSKEFRFDGITPMFEAGEVLLPNSAGWLPDYERELIGFPTANFDDQVDSTSQYLAWARIRRRGGTKKLGGVNVPAASQTSTPAPAGLRGSRGRAQPFRTSKTPSGRIAG